MNSIELLVRRAIALDGADAEARSLLSNALWRRADYEGARAEAERALAMTPNLASAHDMLGGTLIFSGRPKEGIAALEKSIRLDPRDPRSAHRLNRLALALYFTGEYLAAVEMAKRAIRSHPDFPLSYRWRRLLSANWVEPKRHGKRWRRRSPFRQLRSTSMSERARPGSGRKTTPICSKACARLAGASDGCQPPSPGNMIPFTAFKERVTGRKPRAAHSLAVDRHCT